MRPNNQKAFSVVFVNFFSDELVRSRASELEAAGHEVIVVDNSETYGTRPGVVTSCGRNVGFAMACNLGYQTASNDTVVFHNPDLSISLAGIESLVKRLRNQPAPGLAVPALETPQGLRAHGYRLPTPARELALGLGLPPLGKGASDPGSVRLSSRFGSGALLAASRKALVEVGGFDERFFLYGEDLDLWLRVQNARHDVDFVPEVTATHERASSGPLAEATRALLRAVGIEFVIQKHNLWPWPVARIAHWGGAHRYRRSDVWGDVGPSWRRWHDPTTVLAALTKSMRGE